jgi:hypothetical protein
MKSSRDSHTHDTTTVPSAPLSEVTRIKPASPPASAGEQEQHQNNMNAKLETIAAKAADDLPALIGEAEDNILDAMSKATEEAALTESPVKFRLAYTITMDLDKSTQENKLSWSVRHSLSHTSQIEDPKQTSLPFGATVEIRTGDKTTGQIPVEKFKQAVNRRIKN